MSVLELSIPGWKLIPIPGFKTVNPGIVILESCLRFKERGPPRTLFVDLLELHSVALCYSPTHQYCTVPLQTGKWFAITYRKCKYDSQPLEDFESPAQLVGFNCLVALATTMLLLKRQLFSIAGVQLGYLPTSLSHHPQHNSGRDDYQPVLPLAPELLITILCIFVMRSMRNRRVNIIVLQVDQKYFQEFTSSS